MTADKETTYVYTILMFKKAKVLKPLKQLLLLVSFICLLISKNYTATYLYWFRKYVANNKDTPSTYEFRV